MRIESTINGVLPEELYAQICSGKEVEVLDVSTSGEFVGAHVNGACNAPIHSRELDRLMGMRISNDCKVLYVMCAGGVRSVKVCRQYADANLVNIEGGLKRWRHENLPVVREKNVMALDRQVRIAAGSLVVAGCTLAAFAHPAFLLLAGGVGAGLVHAGMTNTCGMAAVLTKMPWNRAEITAKSVQTVAHS